jgi:hypothetical protein
MDSELEKLSHWANPILVDYTFDTHGNNFGRYKYKAVAHGGRFVRDQTIDPMVSTTVVENDGM